MLRHCARGPSLELLAIAFVLVGTAADASQTYSLMGKFVSNQGRLINFPLIGDTPCPSITVMVASEPPGTAGWDPMTEPANPVGCVPAVVKVTTTGKGVGGGFELPPNAFGQPASTSHWLPVKYSPPLKQISTSIAFTGPAVARTGPPGSMADGMNTAAFRGFRAGAWTTQTGRVAANFSWCAGDPACTDPNPKKQIVKYLTRPNQFGGTMGLLMVPGANGSKLVLQAIQGGAVTFLPLVASGSRPTGAGYAVKRTDPSVPGSAWAMYMTSMGRITMGTTYLGPRPGAARMNYGFPFTTGSVLVRNVGGTPTTTLTAHGSDKVTAMGARNISLVAGGVSVGGPLDTGQPNISQVVLPEPGAAGLVAGVVALLVVAAMRIRSD